MNKQMIGIGLIATAGAVVWSVGKNLVPKLFSAVSTLGKGEAEKETTVADKKAE